MEWRISMKLLTFNEWLHNQPALKDDDCKYCEGDGFVESPISQDWFDDCEKCGGTGNTHYKEYELQIKKDKRLLESIG